MVNYIPQDVSRLLIKLPKNTTMGMQEECVKAEKEHSLSEACRGLAEISYRFFRFSENTHIKGFAVIQFIDNASN